MSALPLASPIQQVPPSLSFPSSPTEISNSKPTTRTIAYPQTPISSELMSVSTQRHDSPSTHIYSSYAVATPQLTSSETSPSTVAMSTQQSSQQLFTSVANTISTPASSIERSGAPFIKSADNDEDIDGDVQMGYGEEMSPGKMMSLIEGDMEHVPSQETEDHRRSDHERQGNTEADMKETSQDNVGLSQATEQGKSSQEGSTRWSRASILERLQADVGPLYMLCRFPHPVMRPHPTQDLLSLYSQKPLAATVARTDPVTGEKRKIRKTYKGKIQQFGLAGRNQEVKHPEGKPGGLVEMMHWPDEEWQNQKVAGKELEKGLGEATLSKLERAMKMSRGPLPGFDASVLGLDNPAPISQDSKKPSQPPVNNIRQQTPNTTNTTNQSAAKTTNTPRPTTNNPPPTSSATGEAARPKRTGKKRRYDEHSFEGYGEGFVDDEIGYSTSDREERRNSSTTSTGVGSGAKKRKKNTTDPYNNTGPSHPALERGSYGVGMVGIGSGVGAYGAR